MSGVVVAGSPLPSAEPAGPGPIRPIGEHGLLMDLVTMAAGLERELRRGAMLDAYLLAAGISQIVDDYLHAPVYALDAASDYLGARAGCAARLGCAAADALMAGARLWFAQRPSTATVLRWRRHLGALVDRLARWQVCPPAGSVEAAALWPEADALTRGLDQLPLRLRQAVVRLPACFHTFDQRPRDVVALVSRFAERQIPFGRTLLVAGVRTSGSYLAPLCAAGLRAAGYRRVRMLTLRPGHPLLPHERRLVGSVGDQRGLGLLLDDPPVTGNSLAAAAVQLEGAGLRPTEITLILQTFVDSAWPDVLRHYDRVVLPSNEWSIEADLAPATVRDALSALLGGASVALEADPVPLPPPQPARGHVRRRFRVRTLDAAGVPAEVNVLVEGVGTGYLGAHRLAGDGRLERFAPVVFGLQDGLLYREWLPDAQRVAPVSSGEEDAIAAAAARYALERRAALPVVDDLTRRMAGEQPAWEVASRLLSPAFGRAWPVAHVLVVGRAMKRVLRVQRPSVVDGNTDLAQWFRRDGSLSRLIKPDVGEDRFSNLSACCCDAAFDLAGVTARAGTPALSEKLRRTFAKLSGDVVDEERWLVYELVHLWGRERTQPDQSTQIRRARARALQRYFADVYLRDAPGGGDGPMCALDIDGVLETDMFGFSALTPMAALVLRSLRAHHYRAILASGRSAGEVADRCRAYGLAGGVAEYGAVIFNCASGQIDPLISDDAHADLERLRVALREIGGVHVDPAYRFSVRAFVIERGRRGPLPADVSAEALVRARASRFHTIVGESQTDFVAAGVNKAAGLRALAAGLGIPAERPFVLAVGDTISDLTFAEVARRVCAPRHAKTALAHARFEVMRRPYQAGLAEAVGGLIGHPPGDCPMCSMPPPARERAILQALLGAREQGRLGMVRRAVRVYRLAMGSDAEIA